MAIPVVSNTLMSVYVLLVNSRASIATFQHYWGTLQTKGLTC